MEDINLPAHRVPFEYFGALLAAMHLDSSQQLPLNALAAGRRVWLHRVDDGKIQSRISVLLAERRQHPDSIEADIQVDTLIGVGANFNEMPADSFNIAHFSLYCVIPVAGQPRHSRQRWRSALSEARRR